MGKIVAIGGGSLGEGDTFSIDREICELTETSSPVATFIPTASEDDEEYIAEFQHIYGEKLDCKTQSLQLLNTPPPQDQLEQYILQSDLIYVGGGNTKMMMNRWQELGVDQLLKKAFRRNIVLSGLSAGALCWFDHGHSDSMYYESPEDWEYIRVQGLGLIPGLGCPHFHEEDRVESFKNMVINYQQPGIALDDCTALEVIDDQFRIRSDGTDYKAYRIVPTKNRTQVSSLPETNKYQPISELYP